jgi:hypothetical protein
MMALWLSGVEIAAKRMAHRLRPSVIALMLAASAMGLHAQAGRGFGGPPPDVTGKWTGIWNAYDPAQGATPPKEMCKTLDATITKEGETWKAVFEGDCGRPYKYNITMEGRAVGPTVMFKGTADLGAKDGGVFDWVGRANGKQFVGFYTSAYATGTFSLTRVP